jgi:hypothetical protein
MAKGRAGSLSHLADTTPVAIRVDGRSARIPLGEEVEETRNCQ